MFDHFQVWSDVSTRITRSVHIRLSLQTLDFLQAMPEKLAATIDSCPALPKLRTRSISNLVTQLILF